MNLPLKRTHLPPEKDGFTLIEMVAVIAILVTLMTAGISLLRDNGAQSRKTGADMLTGQIERARTAAITSRTNVILVIAEPGDLPTGDERCRIGMFRVDNWPENPGPGMAVNGVLMSRWQTINTGVVIASDRVAGARTGDDVGVENPMDQSEITVNYQGGGKEMNVTVHAIGFNQRGGLLYPSGSTPVTFRIAEGGYRSGGASVNRSGPDKTISENRLKVGRVIARCYRSD